MSKPMLPSAPQTSACCHGLAFSRTSIRRTRRVPPAGHPSSRHCADDCSQQRPCHCCAYLKPFTLSPLMLVKQNSNMWLCNGQTRYWCCHSERQHVAGVAEVTVHSHLLTPYAATVTQLLVLAGIKVFPRRPESVQERLYSVLGEFSNQSVKQLKVVPRLVSCNRGLVPVTDIAVKSATHAWVVGRPLGWRPLLARPGLATSRAKHRAILHL